MEMQATVPSESGVSIGYGLVDLMQLLPVGCKAYQSCYLKLSTSKPLRSSKACRWNDYPIKALLDDNAIKQGNFYL